MRRSVPFGNLCRRVTPSANPPYPASVHACPDLAAANQAAERTAFQLERIRSLHGEIAGKDLALLRTVDLAAPLVGAVRPHVEHDLHADQRAVALAGVGIVLVALRLRGLGIVGLAQPDDAAAHRAAAIDQAHPRLAALGEPGAER